MKMKKLDLKKATMANLNAENLKKILGGVKDDTHRPRTYSCNGFATCRD